MPNAAALCNGYEKWQELVEADSSVLYQLPPWAEPSFHIDTFTALFMGKRFKLGAMEVKDSKLTLRTRAEAGLLLLIDAIPIVTSDLEYDNITREEYIYPIIARHNCPLALLKKLQDACEPVDNRHLPVNFSKPALKNFKKTIEAAKKISDALKTVVAL